MKSKPDAPRLTTGPDREGAVATPDQSTGPKYVAFLSYSNSDRKAAHRLHRRLERYILPPRLRPAFGRREYAMPLRPIFRDEDDLVPGHELPERIQDALERSRFLIVLCSPAAARSAWVEREIIEFSALGRGENILAVVISGEPHAVRRGLAEELEALPPALRFKISPTDGANATWEISDSPAEPLWVDLRGGNRGRRTAFLRIVAALLALPSLDRLIRRDFRGRWLRRLGMVAVALVMLTTLWLVARLPGALAERYFDQFSQSEALELAGTASIGPDGDLEVPGLISQDGQYSAAYSGRYWQVDELVGGRWRVGWHSRSLWNRSLAVDQRFANLSLNEPGYQDYDFPPQEGVSPREGVRLGVMPFRPPGSWKTYRIVVAQSRDQLDRERAAATPIMMGGAATGLLGFIGWLGWRRWRFG